MVDVGQTCRTNRVLNMSCQKSDHKHIELPKALANLDPKAEFKRNFEET